MKLQDFAELMGVSIKEAEAILNGNDIVTIHLKEDKSLKNTYSQKDKLDINYL